tara:strand:- start:934 stop:1341 length:408 start_codon:yes stop_codon:yes gene_type:complete
MEPNQEQSHKLSIADLLKGKPGKDGIQVSDNHTKEELMSMNNALISVLFQLRDGMFDAMSKHNGLLKIVVDCDSDEKFKEIRSFITTAQPLAVDFGDKKATNPEPTPEVSLDDCGQCLDCSKNPECPAVKHDEKN